MALPGVVRKAEPSAQRVTRRSLVTRMGGGSVVQSELRGLGGGPSDAGGWLVFPLVIVVFKFFIVIEISVVDFIPLVVVEIFFIVAADF